MTYRVVVTPDAEQDLRVDGFREDDKKNAIRATVAFAVEQLADGLLEGPAFGSEGTAFRVARERLNAFSRTFDPPARGSGSVSSNVAAASRLDVRPVHRLPRRTIENVLNL